MLNGEPERTLRVNLGVWFGKPRSFTITLPGKRGLTASQVTGWFDYESIEPFGENRSELRHGQLLAMHHNLNRDPEKKKEPWQSIEKVLTQEQIQEKIDREVFGL